MIKPKMLLKLPFYFASKLVSYILFFVLLSNFVTAQATLPVSTSALDVSALPTGFSQVGLGSNYTGFCGTALKFDGTGDYTQLFFIGIPGALSYDLRAFGVWDGTFTVTESSNGVSWTTLRTITGASAISTFGSSYTDNPLATTRYIRWTYTLKNSGNTGMCNVNIALPPCTPPTTQSSFTSITSIGTTGMSINFGAGAGAGRIVLVKQGSAVAGTPTNATDYSAGVTNNFSTTAQTIAAGEKVMYVGTGANTVNIVGLTPSTTYYVKVFEYSATFCYNNSATGNTGNATTNALVVTAFEAGDFAIIAVNNQAYDVPGSSTADEISFVTFKDILPGTIFSMTDNGYERNVAGKFGATEGVIDITRNAAATSIAAGTIITLRGTGSGNKDNSSFDILICGTADNSNWTIAKNYVSPNSKSFDLNIDDQVWFMQGGSWTTSAAVPGSAATIDNTTFTSGVVLYGWSSIYWKPDLGSNTPFWNVAGTKGSTIYPSMKCFTMSYNAASSGANKIKYTGLTTATTKFGWISRIDNVSNWTVYGTNTLYNASPDYAGTCINFPVDVGTEIDGKWKGTSSSDWFDCANWDTRKVPDANTNVTISATATNNNLVDKTSGYAYLYSNIANCKNLAIDNKTLSLQNADQLYINGNLTLSNAANLTVTNNGYISLKGDWSNTSASFNSGTGLVEYTGANQNIGAEAYYNLGLSGTGTKTAPTGTVVVKGNLDKYTNCNFLNNGGTFSFEGTGTQTYTAVAPTMEFKNLINKNSALGLTTASDMGIENLLTINAASKLTFGAGNIHIRSTNSYTANVDKIDPTVVINYTGAGRFSVERYLFTQKAWRFLATPVTIASSPTVTTAWREGAVSTASTGYGTQITGPASYVGMDADTPRGSLKWFNDAANVWTEINNSTNVLANNTGYMVFVRGDRAVAVGGSTGATNLRIKGMIRTGDQTFTVLANKFQSFGNPYPARINFRTVTKTNIVNGFTVWNPTIPGLYNVGGYETYAWNGTDHYTKVPGGQIKDSIESGEAVFIHTNLNAPGSITIKESDKRTGSAMVSRVGVTRPTLEVNMYTKDANGADYLADGVMLNFDNTYSAAIDNLDVRKISNTYDNLAIKNGNYSLVVECRPNLQQTDSIKLNITGMRTAAYRFEIDPSVPNYPGLEAQLKDKFLQTETPMSFGTVTTYNFDITTAAASKAADRFMIVFKQAATTNFTAIAATRNADKTVTINWGTQNETNVANYSVEQSNDGINFTAIATKVPTANNGTNPTYSILDATASKAANWYRVKANNTNATTKYTGVAMVNALIETATTATAKISIYPNPVEDGVVNLHMDNEANGNYAVQITNATGQTIQTENVQVENNNTLRTIKMGNAATGSYQLMIIDEAGKKTTIPFIIK